jgi:hypothetical protein
MRNRKFKMAFRFHVRPCLDPGSAGRGTTIALFPMISLITLVLYGAATGTALGDNNGPKAAPAPGVMRFACVSPDRTATYVVDIDIANGAASYFAEVHNVGGRWGPFPASVSGERVSWDQQSVSDVNSAGWTRSHWSIERSSGHMRIEAENSHGQSRIQRNIICKRR